MADIREIKKPGRTWGPDQSGTARRVFEVTQCASIEDAKAALAVPPLEVAEDKQYPGEPTLLVRNIAGEMVGGLITLNVDYATTQAGSWQSNSDTKTRIRWESFTISDRSDRDADGNALLNAARIPFEGGQDVSLVGKRLTVIKTYTRYKLNTFWGFENSINDADVILDANTFRLDADVTVPADCFKCTLISPVSDYTSDATKIAQQFVYEMLLIEVNGELLTAPFDYRFANKSTVGWGTIEGVTQKGIFVNERGQILPDPQLIDANGLPLDTSVRVMVAPWLPLTTPVAPPDGAPTGAVFETTGYGTFVRYKKCPRKSFASFEWFEGAA